MTLECDMEAKLQEGFRLGEWLVQPLANLLICDRGETHIEPKLMDVLVHLAALQMMVGMADKAGSALDLAASLINSTPADSKFLYIASDFREREKRAGY